MTDYKKTLEEGAGFTPRFDANGLISCVTTNAKTGDVVMLAYMNREALDKTIETREAWYWSRSRNKLWHKGAESGFTQKVVSIRTDCDQDAILLKVEIAGGDTACHTGRKTCFYREIISKEKLKPV